MTDIPTYPDRAIEIEHDAVDRDDQGNVVWQGVCFVARSMHEGRQANAMVRVAPGFLDDAADARWLIERELDSALLRLVYRAS